MIRPGEAQAMPVWKILVVRVWVSRSGSWRAARDSAGAKEEEVGEGAVAGRREVVEVTAQMSARVV
jgi:hypothetical protein